MSERVKRAQGDEQAVHTVLLVNGLPGAVLVSMPWRRRAAHAVGERVDLAAIPVVPVTELRDRLGSHVGEHALAAKRGLPVAALVPWDWYLRAAKALGESVDI